MFLGEIIFCLVCLSVYGLFPMTCNYRLTISFDDCERLRIHSDLLNLLAFRDRVVAELLPLCEPRLARPIQLSTLTALRCHGVLFNPIYEHTKCCRLRWILL